MPFKVGDRVKVVGVCLIMTGHMGIVEKVLPNALPHFPRVSVRFDSETKYRYYVKELELVEEPYIAIESLLNDIKHAQKMLERAEQTLKEMRKIKWNK